VKVHIKRIERRKIPGGFGFAVILSDGHELGGCYECEVAAPAGLPITIALKFQAEPGLVIQK
jgi:hypothetical protein